MTNGEAQEGKYLVSLARSWKAKRLAVRGSAITSVLHMMISGVKMDEGGSGHVTLDGWMTG